MIMTLTLDNNDNVTATTTVDNKNCDNTDIANVNRK